MYERWPKILINSFVSLEVKRVGKVPTVSKDQQEPKEIKVNEVTLDQKGRSSSTSFEHRDYCCIDLKVLSVASDLLAYLEYKAKKETKY